MTTQKTAKLILQIDVGVQAIYWMISALLFSFLSGLQTFHMIILAVLMFLNGLAYGYFALFERKWILANDYVLLAFLLVNTILSVTDQMGLFDFIILGLNLLAMLYCILASDYLFRRKNPGSGA
jgi:hypothetical protein